MTTKSAEYLTIWRNTTIKSTDKIQRALALHVGQEFGSDLDEILWEATFSFQGPKSYLRNLTPMKLITLRRLPKDGNNKEDGSGIAPTILYFVSNLRECQIEPFVEHLMVILNSLRRRF